MQLENLMINLPETKGVVVILSGGMDSTIAMRICVEKYGAENVRALSFFYGQRQRLELDRAKESTGLLGVKHKILDLSILGEIGQGFSANVDTGIQMPTIKDVLGDPRPKSYIPNRNMILLSISAAFAEVENIDTVIMGLQSVDQYGYWDTTPTFVQKVNEVLNENRMIKIKLTAPFAHLTKTEEINLLKELDGNLDLLKHTLTCYNPNERGESCGVCPTCAERVKAFMNVGEVDPVPYSINIPWRV